IRPLLGGLAEDRAAALPGGAAVDIAEYHHASAQGGSGAACKTSLHPAHALAPRRVTRQMLLGLQSVEPVHVAVEAAGFAVLLEVDGLDVDHALEHVQARAGAEQAAVIPGWPLLCHLPRKPCPGMPAGGGIDAPGLLQSRLADQFA